MLVVFILCKTIAIFIFGPFGLKLPLHAPFGEFWGILSKWIPISSQPPRGPSLGKTRRMSHKPWKPVHGFQLGACPRKMQYNKITEKSQNRNISTIWGGAPAEWIEWKFALVQISGTLSWKSGSNLKSFGDFAVMGSKFTLSHWLST